MWPRSPPPPAKKGQEDNTNVLPVQLTNKQKKEAPKKVVWFAGPTNTGKIASIASKSKDIYTKAKDMNLAPIFGKKKPQVYKKIPKTPRLKKK